DNFPFRRYSPGLVYALLMAWLEEHANPLREAFHMDDPSVDPQFDDEGACLLDITVGLADPLIIREQEDGPIPYRGKRWALVNPEIWTAETMQLFVNRGHE
ncbi:phage tail protein, partial [Escherichia coli]|nr:phage tail protein [Escherichia coli]